jgi:hypothetical protein
MKPNTRSALVLALFAFVGCKAKETPVPAASSASLSGGAPAASAAGTSLAVLDNFEGQIDLSAKGKFAGKDAATPTNVTLLVKDGKFRFDLPEGLEGAQSLGKAYLIVEPADKKLYAVMDAKKQVVLIDLDKLVAQAKTFGAQPHAADANGNAAEVQKTGKTDTVAGYSCEIWHITSKKSVGDLCIAEQGTSFFHIPLTGVPAEYAWASEITDGKHFPLRFVASENGAEQGRLEVTSIQKKALPAEEFTVPAGYNVLNLEQMLGAMMGMGGMPLGMPAMASAAPGTPAGLPPGFVLPPGVVLPPAALRAMQAAKLQAAKNK